MKSDAKLPRDRMKPGQILTMATRSPMGWGIRRFLAPAFRKLVRSPMSICPNHTAIVVPDVAGNLAIGEAKFPRAGLTTLDQFDGWMRSGFVRDLMICEPLTLEETLERAANAWIRNIMGTLYDFTAIPRIAVKLAVVDLGWGMGAEWAWYCTEGVAQAYRLAGHDAYGGKRYPTPYTDLKRAVDGMWLVKWAMTDGRPR